jgi:hypothetical protein
VAQVKETRFINAGLTVTMKENPQSNDPERYFVVGYGHAATNEGQVVREYRQPLTGLDAATLAALDTLRDRIKTMAMADLGITQADLNEGNAWVAAHPDGPTAQATTVGARSLGSR